MAELCLMIFIPFFYAFFIPYIYKYVNRIHTGWFVLPVPVVLFWYLISNLGANNNPVLISWSWIPSLDINITLHADGLAMLFGVLVSGIGVLVVLYSIYYLSKEREHYITFMSTCCYLWEPC